MLAHGYLHSQAAPNFIHRLPFFPFPNPNPAESQAGGLIHELDLEFSQLAAETVHGFGCDRERGIEVHEQDPTPSFSESFRRLKTRNAVAPRTAMAKADGSGTGVIWKENVAFIFEVNWGRNWFRLELSNISSV